MDAGTRSSGRQPAAPAPRLPTASDAPPRPSAGPRPPASCIRRVPMLIILVKNKRTTTHQACIHPIPIFSTLIKTIDF
jgi:hypothetical protein